MLLGSSSSAIQVDIVGGSASATGSTTSGATSRYTLTNAGLEQTKEGTASYVTLGTWLKTGVASDYDVFVTVVSGSVSSGSTGVWLNLGTTREWTKLGADGAGASSVVLTIQLRRTSTGAVLDSASVTLTSDFATA